MSQSLSGDSMPEPWPGNPGREERQPPGSNFLPDDFSTPEPEGNKKENAKKRKRTRMIVIGAGIIVIIILGAGLAWLMQVGGPIFPTKSRAAEQNYFYARREKIFFTEDSNRIAIEFQSANTMQVVLQQRDADLRIDTSYTFYGNIVVVEGSDATLNRLHSANRNLSENSMIDAGRLITVSETGGHFIHTENFVAKFKASTPRRTIDSLASVMDCQIIEADTLTTGRYIFRATRESVIDKANYLYETGLVDYAHPDFIGELEVRAAFYPNDALFKDLWHLHNTGQLGGKVGADIKAPEAWGITVGNASVHIAFIDDAFDVNHEDLKENSLKGMDFSDTPNDNDVSPREAHENHGTNVIGVAIAKGNNKLGVSGSCPQCNFIPIRALGGPISRQASAFTYAMKQGASIISNSWGYLPRTVLTDDIVDAVQTAATQGRGGLGCIIVVAMTNDKRDNCVGRFGDLSSLPNVIAVSRSTNEDKCGKAGYGKCIDLLAPTRGGTMAITTTDFTGAPGKCAEDYFTDFGGTSSSAPLVAGVVGLMLSINPTLHRTDVERILHATADKIDSVAAKYDINGFSNTHGYGRVNAFSAVNEARKK